MMKKLLNMLKRRRLRKYYLDWERYLLGRGLVKSAAFYSNLANSL